jgi:hypothetical protein
MNLRPPFVSRGDTPVEIVQFLQQIIAICKAYRVAWPEKDPLDVMAHAGDHTRIGSTLRPAASLTAPDSRDRRARHEKQPDGSQVTWEGSQIVREASQVILEAFQVTREASQVIWEASTSFGRLPKSPGKLPK